MWRIISWDSNVHDLYGKASEFQYCQMCCYFEFWLSGDPLLMISDGYDYFCAG